MQTLDPQYGTTTGTAMRKRDSALLGVLFGSGRDDSTYRT